MGSFVMRGHSRSKNGVASLAYAPRIHRFRKMMDCRVKPGNDEKEAFLPCCALGLKCSMRKPKPPSTAGESA
jgi:hypothetical protein